MSTIVLNAKNYVGEGIQNGLTFFREKSAGLVAGFNTLTGRIAFNPTKTVVAWKLVKPTLATESDECACAGTVLREAIIDITVRLDRAATQAERDAIAEDIEDLVATSQFKTSITGFVTPN